jgi:hypothetical protein
VPPATSHDTGKKAYVSIRAKWHYLYRALDKYGKTVDFLLRRDRGIAAAQAFLRKSFPNAAITIAGIELAHRMRKGQFSCGRGRRRRGCSRKAEWVMAFGQERAPRKQGSRRDQNIPRCTRALSHHSCGVPYK